MSKKYSHLVSSSISILCLIVQATPSLAQTSLPGDTGASGFLYQSSPAIDSVPTPETSVSQLSDVQPTDWAFLAVRSLVARYGLGAGDSEGNYLGNKAISRYEFAAQVNVLLQRVNRLVNSGFIQEVSRDDLETLQRLEQEFAAELLSLRGRIDNFEVRVAELDANQFSATTKLTGQTIVAVNGGGFGGDRLLDPTGREIANDNPNTTLLYRAALDFDTSFFGTDLLKVRLDTGSNGGVDNAAGILEPNFGSVLDFSVKPPRDGEFGIGRLYYTFTPVKDFQVSVGPTIVPTDYIDRNSYANRNFLDFSTQALVNNYILFPINERSSGAVINWNPSNTLTVRAMYVAADAANPSDRGIVEGLSALTRLLYPPSGGNRGLFGDPYQGMVELEYAPDKAFTLRLQYSGGNVFDRRFDVLGANFEFAVSRRLGIFGRYGYGNYDDTIFGDIAPHYWMAGVAFRNLLVPGATAGIAAGQPFIESAVGNATQTNFEAFYNFPFSDRFAIAPLVQVIANPANQDDNNTIVTGTLRTVFSF